MIKFPPHFVLPGEIRQIEEFCFSKQKGFLDDFSFVQAKDIIDAIDQFNEDDYTGNILRWIDTHHRFLINYTSLIIDQTLYVGGPLWKSLYLFLQSEYIIWLDTAHNYALKHQTHIDLPITKVLKMMQYLETISSSKAKDFQTKYFYKIKAKDPKEYEPFPRSLDVFLVTAQDEDLILIIADSIDFQIYEQSEADHMIKKESILFCFMKYWNLDEEQIHKKKILKHIKQKPQYSVADFLPESPKEFLPQILRFLQLTKYQNTSEKDIFSSIFAHKQNSKIVGGLLCLQWKHFFSAHPENQYKQLMDLYCYFMIGLAISFLITFRGVFS